jgi:FkbM family methyltransferase
MSAPDFPAAEIAAGHPKAGKRLQAVLHHLRHARYDRDDLLQFLAFAMPMAAQSKGQFFQDLWALWTSGQRRNGYFVEFGAGDGETFSNTWLLERQMGWTGVIAEPNPAFAEALRQRRCIVSPKCVYARSGERLSFLAARMGELSRIADVVPADGNEEERLKGAELIEVETIALNDLLTQARAPSRIDYMSVDTEGSELEILKAFDFDRWDVRAISVEHNGTGAREQLFELLTSHGYRRPWPDMGRVDDWYVRG